MRLFANELRRFGSRRGGELKEGQFAVPWNASVSNLTGKMAIRFGVYFDDSNPFYGNTVLLPDREEGKIVREWLRDSVLGKYSVQSSYVFFEDEHDAVLCYLAFR